MGRKGLKRTTPKQTSPLPMYVSYIRSKKMLHNDNRNQTIQYLFLMGFYVFFGSFPRQGLNILPGVAPPGFLCTIWPTLPVLGTGPFNVRILVVALLGATKKSRYGRNWWWAEVMKQLINDGWSTYFYPQKTQDRNSKPNLRKITNMINKPWS